MTNYEKYKDELIKKAIIKTPIAMDIHTGKVVDCGNMDCRDCGFSTGKGCCIEDWLDSEYVEPEKEEVDWSKVPIDTKVIVSDDNENWYRRHFAYYRGERIWVFRSGLTSWTINDLSEVSGWKYGKLLEDGK